VEATQSWDCFKVYNAQATIYLTVLIDLKRFKEFHSDKDFIKKFLEEENVNVFPLSVMGPRFHGFRLMSCATDRFYDQFFERLERFVKRHINE